MKAYGYIAYTDDGRRRTGTVVAETESHATQQLSARALYVSDLTERSPGQGRAGLGRAGLGRALLNADLQAVFTRQMAVLLGAEMPAEAALEAVRVSGSTPALDAMAARARASLMDGAPLAEAIAHSGAGFPPYYIASVRAGEEAGDLAAVFAELADHLENLGTDKAQISTALIYPGFVAAVSLLVCAILMVNVAPEIVALFEISGRPLPELTRVTLAISRWIEDHAIALALAGTALVLLGVLSGRVARLKALRDRACLRLPLVGRFMRHAAAVQYLRTLALVLSSRHTVPDAVGAAAQVLNVARFQHEAGRVSEAVRAGETLSSALTRLSIIPPVARQLISAGEASARLARMTERSALLVENALSVERKRIAALLEPALMILVGVFVLLIVLAVLLPIFDLQSVVTR